MSNYPIIYTSNRNKKNKNRLNKKKCLDSEIAEAVEDLEAVEAVLEIVEAEVVALEVKS